MLIHELHGVPHHFVKPGIPLSVLVIELLTHHVLSRARLDNELNSHGIYPAPEQWHAVINYMEPINAAIAP